MIKKTSPKSIASDEAPLPRMPPVDLDLADERLIGKADVCAMTNMSFVTIWKLMRAKKFPRARDLGGGKISWLKSEIMFWIKNRPFRKYDGDTDGVAPPNYHDPKARARKKARG
jgi:predicted DNA-binding transcriptional regulator AlpA